MALNKVERLRSAVFKALLKCGAKTRWVKGWEIGVELPQYRWREIRLMLGTLDATRYARWGWSVASKRGTGGGYKMVRRDG